MSGRGMTAGGASDSARERAAHGRDPPGAASFSHAALLYHGRGGADFGWVAAITRRAAEAADPLHVAVPAETTRVIADSSQRPPGNSRLIDMSGLGRNPAGIIAAGLSFADEHPGQHIYCCGNQPGRPARAELLEVARHEALRNLAFDGKPMTIACLYDAARLGDDHAPAYALHGTSVSLMALTLVMLRQRAACRC
jgi:hypothetical protein